MDRLEKGTILVNTYEILEEIGSGGGGITYRGRHLRLNTDIVVKKIRNEVIKKIDIRKEADILKELKHAYLPRVYDFIEDGDDVYTVIDYIPGDNLLDAVSKHGPFEYKRVLKWTNQLAEALAYLHSLNPCIIHSDIKPANIMLTEDDNICLIDFNISLALGAERESAVGVSLGFSPPEQYVNVEYYSEIVSHYSNGFDSESTYDNSTDDYTNIDSNKNSVEEVKKNQDNISELTISDKTAYEELKHMTTNSHMTGNQIEAQEYTNIDNYETNYEGKISYKENLKNNRGLEQKTSSYTKRTKNENDYTVHIGRGIDTRSDIYSLGMSILFVLSGVEPSADYSYRIDSSEIETLVPEGFGTIIEKMISYNPDDRYKDGNSLLDSLRNIHKLDSRYRKAHRIKRILGTSSIITLIAGISIAAYGFMEKKNDNNSLYNSYIDQAEERILEQEYDEARTLINKALTLDSKRGEAYKETVYLDYSMGNYDKAIEDGTSYINSPSFKMVLDQKYEEIGNDNQDIGDVYYLIGNAYYEKKDYQSASEYLGKALEYNSTNGLYYRDYALALLKLERKEDAMIQVEEADKLGLSDDSMRLLEGQIAFNNDEYELAIDKFKECIKKSTSDLIEKRAILLCSDSYNKLGNLYIDDNIEMLESNKDKFGQSGSLMLKEYLAIAYMEKGKTESDYNNKAINIFKEMIADGYGTLQTEENIAMLYANMGESDQAKEHLLMLIDKYPNEYEVYRDLAYVEILVQKELDLSYRDYKDFKKYYDKAVLLCNTSDDVMEMLRRAEEDLNSAGWGIK